MVTELVLLDKVTEDEVEKLRTGVDNVDPVKVDDDGVFDAGEVVVVETLFADISVDCVLIFEVVTVVVERLGLELVV